jgi:SSS family solute:Na+ symporter
MILAAIVTYFVIAVVVSALMRARIKLTSDFLVAGRHLGLVLGTASLAAVQIGAGVVLGGAEDGAARGLWPGMWYGFGCGAGLIVAGLVAAKRLRTLGGVVPIDFFSMRYGERRWVRTWAWLLNIPNLIGIFAVQLMAAGALLSGFGFDFTYAVLLVAGIVLFVNVMSGMWGVVSVDFVQLCVIATAVPLTLLVLGFHSGAPVVRSIVATPVVPYGLASRAVFLILPSLFSVSVSYDAVIRYQATRSADTARWACIFAGLVVIAVSFCTSFIGAAGKRAFPGVANAAILTHVVVTMLHPAVAGVVIAALLGAAMGTANSLLISIAGCFSRDFYNKILHPSKELDELPHATRYARLAVLGAAVIGVTLALNARGILDTIIIFMYPYAASMLVPLMAGLLWPRTTRQGAYAAMGVGGVIGISAFVVGVPGPLHGAFNIDLALLVAFAVSTVVLVAVSLATTPPQATMETAK